MDQERIQVVNPHPLKDPIHGTDQLLLRRIIAGNLVIRIGIQAALRLDVEIVPVKATLLKSLAEVDFR